MRWPPSTQPVPRKALSCELSAGSTPSGLEDGALSPEVESWVVCHGNYVCGSAPACQAAPSSSETPLAPRGAHLQVPHPLSWPLRHVSDSSPSRRLSVEPPDMGAPADRQVTAKSPSARIFHPGCPGRLWQVERESQALPLPSLCALSSGPSWTHTCLAPKWGP